MLRKLISSVLVISMLLGLQTSATFASDETSTGSARQMEYLTRGAIGASIDGNIYLSWRLLGTEPMDTKFNIYCNNEKIVEELDNTNYTHIGGNSSNKYQISAVINGVEQARSNDVTILEGHRDSSWKNSPYAYMDIPITAPKPNNCSYYDANDASVGDLDCDGEYEIVLKWNPDNAKDNSQSGVTGNVYIDAYKMDGTLLWRIDLGRNIRAGAHYTQYMVYDFDGDGKAEVAMKTAPGSKDGQGKYVTEAGVSSEIKNADNSKSYINSKGFILDGPEYLTIFDGQTGSAMQTINYKPNRTDEKFWGDKSASQGNRVDRFLAGVAYLDGVHPSLLMCRGYYARSAVTAYDWDGKNLTERWAYDTGDNKSDKFFGQGHHQLSVADLDNDGRDEIIYGSAALDDDGSFLHATGWGHGDALHVSDFNNDGEQEIFNVQEDAPNCGTGFRKADGTVLWKKYASDDTGRGVIANMSPKYGVLAWSSQGIWYDEDDLGSDGNPKKKYFAYDIDGNEVKFSGNSNCSPNFAIYWDGDLYRELADGDRILKWNDNTGLDRLWTISNNNPVSVNNTTKNNPCLQADLFGDWREEYVMRKSDNSALRIFTSITPTDYKLTTFMHDSQYRCAIAWQNVGYNQPPHPSYYIGPDKTEYAQQNIKTAYNNIVSFKVTTDGTTAVEGAKIELDNGAVIITDKDGVAETPILAGEYKYTIKCSGYESVKGNFTITTDEKTKNITVDNMSIKTKCDITVSYLTENGTKIQPSSTLEPVAINSAFTLDEQYKEDIVDSNNVVYEYNPNLSDDITFDKLTDDVEIKLVFDKKNIQQPFGKEYFRTNFAKDGFNPNSTKHGFKATGEATYGTNNGVKCGTYAIGDNTITINLPEGTSNFITEFDMAYNPTDTSAGGAVYGITPYSGKLTGPTIGIRLNGQKTPQFAYFAGGSNYKAVGNITENKMYRYILECDGTKMYLTVGDLATGEVVQDKFEIAGLRNISDVSTQSIDKFTFNRGTGSGNANLSISNFRVYQVGGPNDISWKNKDNIVANLPSQTDLSPENFKFVTGVKGYSIDIPKNEISYELQNDDGTTVSAEKGVSIDEKGVLNVTENAVKATYKVICKYKDTEIKNYSVNVIRSGLVELYNSENDETGDFFKYNGKDGADLSYAKGQWTFNQNSNDGGREFFGEFPSFETGEATLKFTFSTGGTKSDAGEWGWTDREYDYEIQFLDADYDGQNAKEHTSLAFSQKYAAKAQEAQFYTGASNEKSNINTAANAVGTFSDSNGITARSATTWNVTVNFNFDNNTATFDILNAEGAGYRYTDVPINGGFKTLRFVSNSNSSTGKVQWKPTLKGVSYTRYGYEPSEVNADTIKVNGGKNKISVNFDKPYDGDLPVTYKVSLVDPQTGKVAYQKDSDVIPVVFDDVTAGDYKYNVAVTVSNLKADSNEAVAGPFEGTVIDQYPIKASVEGTPSLENGKLTFKAKVTNSSDATNGVICAILYDSNGAVVDKAYSEKDIATGDNYCDFDLRTSGKENVTLKLFIWDSLENMQPIYGAKAFVGNY